MKAGEVDAFEGIVRRWQRPLLNLAYRFCRDRGVAEELVQEAFLRIFRKLHMFREEAVFSTWMFAVATRLFTSHVRRYQPRWLSVDEADQLPSGDDPSRPVDDRSRDEAVRRAVNRLPDRYRDAIILYYFLERGVEEAAGALEISPGTLKSRLHRGRKMLEGRMGALFQARPSPKEA